MRCVKCGLDLQTIGGRVSSPNWGTCPTCAMADGLASLRTDLNANAQHNKIVTQELSKVQDQLQDNAHLAKQQLALQERMVRLEQERVVTLDVAKEMGRKITITNPNAINAKYDWSTDKITVTSNSNVFENAYLQAALIEGATETINSRCDRWTHDTVKNYIFNAGYKGWTNMAMVTNMVDNLSVDTNLAIADFEENVNADYSIQITVTKWFINNAELRQLYLDGLTKRQREMNTDVLIAERRAIGEAKKKQEAQKIADAEQKAYDEKVQKYKLIAMIATLFVGVASLYFL